MTKCAEELASVGVRLRLMLQDEGRFGRINTPRRCWAPRGMRPDVPSQIVREYTYAYVAVSPHDGAMDSLILPHVSEQAMSIFLREVSDRHPDEFILMVMDGAGWHKANALSVPENMALIFLPPFLRDEVRNYREQPRRGFCATVYGEIAAAIHGGYEGSFETLIDYIARDVATLPEDILWQCTKCETAFKTAMRWMEREKLLEAKLKKMMEPKG